MLWICQPSQDAVSAETLPGAPHNPNRVLRLVPDRTSLPYSDSFCNRYILAGNSLGKIADGLERQGILSPTGKPRWNREAIDKLLSNENFANFLNGRVSLAVLPETSHQK